MNRKKINFVVSSMAVLLAVQSPATVWAETVQDTEQQEVTETELPLEEPAQEENLETNDEQVTIPEDAGEEESIPYEEEPLAGMGDELLSGTMEAEEEEAVMFRGTEDITRAGNPLIEEALDKAERHLQATVTDPVVATLAGEWSVMAMARAGYLTDNTKSNYLRNVYVKLDETKGILHNIKYTEYSRVVMALSSIGVNPADVHGYNLLEPLANFNKVNRQGINGTIFALIALDTGNYEIPTIQGEGTQTTRDALIQELLSKELQGGGWTLQGDKADPDITAMTIQGLAPYMEQEDVNAAVNRGINKLASMQDEDGGYSSTSITDDGKPTKNLESTAQVVIALSAVDVSYLEQERFMKNGKTLLDEVVRFQKADGSFEHVEGGGSDAMATDQGTLALLAWQRAVNGQTSLYDMTDVSGKDQGTEAPEAVEAFRKKLEALPSQVTIKEKETIYALVVELELMKSFEEKESFQELLKGKSEEIATQEKEVAELDQRIWNELNPLKITLKEKETVEELLAIYQNLPKENQEFVERGEELKTAEIIIQKLEKGIIGKEIFEKAKVSRQDYVYEGKGYVLRVKGKEVLEPGDMSAEIKIQQEKDCLKFMVSGKGNLPGEVELTMPCTLEDGIYMLYDENQREQQWTAVSDKKVTCDVSRGGTYLLKKGDTGYEDEMEALSGMETKEGDKKPGSSGNSTGGKKTGSNTVSQKSTASSAKKKESSNTIEAVVKNGMVEKKAFEDIKGKDKNLKMKGEIGKDKPYVLTINGKDVKHVKDMKIGIQENSKYAKEMKKLAENPYIFSFEETGDFPGKMQVELTTGQEDGKYLLLKYNAEEKKAEYIQKVTVTDKKTKFLAETGGDYFIAKKAKTKSLDELEAEEKEAATKQTAKEKNKGKMLDAEMEEEELLSGTKQENKILPGVLAAGAVVLAGLGVVVWYFRKRR